MVCLFLLEAYLVVAGCLGFRSREWAFAWLPVYPIARLLFVSASIIDGLVFGLVVAGFAAIAAAVGQALRPSADRAQSTSP